MKIYGWLSKEPITDRQFQALSRDMRLEEVEVRIRVLPSPEDSILFLSDTDISSVFEKNRVNVERFLEATEDLWHDARPFVVGTWAWDFEKEMQNAAGLLSVLLLYPFQSSITKEECEALARIWAVAAALCGIDGPRVDFLGRVVAAVYIAGRDGLLTRLITGGTKC